MRKTTLVAAGLVIGLSMGLAACGSKDTANKNTSKSTTEAVTTAAVSYTHLTLPTT